ncbi:MAG TPA: ice-binding family protein, partial [Candidatus Dormibacteraeota bacterium]
MLGALPTPVLAVVAEPTLGTAANFAVLAATTITNTGLTVINGDLGLDPGTSVTGFPPGTVTAQHIGGTAVQAKADLAVAYNQAAGAPSNSNLSGQDLGGMTLPSGVYTFNSSAGLTGDLHLTGPGVFIFQIGSTITTATGSKVILDLGAQACAVYWQVGSSATFGTGTQFQGNVMALTSITMTTGASLVNGRAMAQNAAVTLDTNAITQPTGTCVPTPPPGVIGISKTADAASASAGTSIGFTVTLSNTGGSAATGVTLTDALPGGNVSTPVHWSIDGSTGNPAAFSISGADGSQALSLAGQPISLGPGASLTVHVTAPTNSQNCAAYANTASVATSDAGSDSKSASETVLCASITITKTADALIVNAGDPIGFTILVANPGAGTADGVTVSDPLPAGSGSGLTWSIDIQSNAGLCSVSGTKPTQVLSCGPTTLASLATFSVHITATTSAAECTLYANTATATTTNDGSGINSATITCHPANVTITKTADATSVNAGDPIGFTILVGNPGTGTANGVTVNDPLPAGSGAGLTWAIDIQSNAGLCSINSATAPQTLSCGPTTLA